MCQCYKEKTWKCPDCGKTISYTELAKENEDRKQKGIHILVDKFSPCKGTGKHISGVAMRVYSVTDKGKKLFDILMTYKEAIKELEGIMEKPKRIVDIAVEGIDKAAKEYEEMQKETEKKDEEAKSNVERLCTITEEGKRILDALVEGLEKSVNEYKKSIEEEHKKVKGSGVTQFSRPSKEEPPTPEPTKTVTPEVFYSVTDEVECPHCHEKIGVPRILNLDKDMTEYYASLLGREKELVVKLMEETDPDELIDIAGELRYTREQIKYIQKLG